MQIINVWTTNKVVGHKTHKSQDRRGQFFVNTIRYTTIEASAHWVEKTSTVLFCNFIHDHLDTMSYHSRKAKVYLTVNWQTNIKIGTSIIGNNFYFQENRRIDGNCAAMSISISDNLVKNLRWNVLWSNFQKV